MAFTYCENCGEKIDDTSKFCPHCGYSKSGAFGDGRARRDGNSYGNSANGNAYDPYGNRGGYNGGYGNGNNGQEPYGDRSGGYGNADNGQNQSGDQNGGYNGQGQYGDQGGYGQGPYGNRGGYGGGQYGNFGGGFDPYRNAPLYRVPYSGNGKPRKVNTVVMVFAIITMVFFNMLCGIIAMVMAMSAPNQPSPALMDKKNQRAILVCILGTVLGIIFQILYVWVFNGFV